MATRDSGKVVQVSTGEALGAQLAERAILAAIDALREGRYRDPTAAEARRVAEIVTLEALAAGLVLCTHPELTDEALDEAAERTGRAAVADVMGPPAPEAVN